MVHNIFCSGRFILSETIVFAVSVRRDAPTQSAYTARRLRISITGLHIRRNGNTLGLFCYVVEAGIENLSLVDGNVEGQNEVGGIVGEANGGTVRHAVSKADSVGQAVGALSGGVDVTTDVKVVAEADMKLAATYTDWKDGSGNAVVATVGGKGSPWRIYEGQPSTLRLCRADSSPRLYKMLRRVSTLASAATSTSTVRRVPFPWRPSASIALARRAISASRDCASNGCVVKQTARERIL